MSDRIVDKLVGLAVSTLLATFGGCLNGGCADICTNGIAYGFRQTSSWELYVEARDTKAEARHELKSQSIEEWIKAKTVDEPDAPPVPMPN